MKTKTMIYRIIIVVLLLFLSIGYFSCDDPDPKEDNDDPSRWSRYGMEDKAILKLRLFDDQLYAITKQKGLYRRNIRDELSEWQYLGFEDTLNQWPYTHGASDVYIDTENPTQIMVSISVSFSTHTADTLIYTSIFVSRDNGITWTPSDAGLVDEQNDSLDNSLYTIAVPYIVGIGNTTYAVCGSRGIYKSENFGNEWELFRYQHEISFGELKIHSTNNQIMWVTKMGVWGSLHISKSSDGGVTWQGLPNSFTSLYEWVEDIEFHPTYPDIVYVGADGIVYRTDDGGSNWVEILPDDSLTYYGVLTVIVDEAQPDHLFIIRVRPYTFNSELIALIESRDKGNTWKVIEEDFPYYILWWQYPVYDPAEHYLYLPTMEGVFRYNSS